ncbi:cysteine--tRNA ligase [Erythrobacter sp. HL-111]|uniref:cysteine--tRNA ligase n=1 Tax=Erythrobacter sp. HL-111 TaxID=1798193 RepID=UPI0006DB8C14|nr:cysteine--tRNA ligase [Erythrobacter sp. HL-111]KPP85257.1 MAG: cysteinyl-tRNA synthetase CysS [Erythrobacteraceae bacterium HL-111]SDS22441.1 cysteinyl-tRNA synthetase [Erythrobacter sp. HL-111]
MTEAPLKLFNSLTRKLEVFEPVHAGEARVYTCGPTVYNYAHIGNMRAYVFADVLGRTLTWKGYDLTHVINITDVGHLTDDADAGEDKLEKAAAGSQRSIREIAAHYTAAFKADVAALNIREPARWSVATDYIDEMIAFAKSIADRHCYMLDSGLYFDVSTVEDYGRLARAVTEEGEGRIDAVEGKRNAADFAIWRTTPPGEKRQMEWDSPWGRGAPGWHLECSVMGEALLGFPFDIHTGGIDHREIHHPNEIAQNQAFCGCGGLDDARNSGAKIWMHNNFLVERSGKMSKSSGEFLRLRLLVEKGYHPLAYRMMCLQAHYRSELEFSWEGLGAALTRLKRMVQRIENLKARHAELVSASMPDASNWSHEEGWSLKQVQDDELESWVDFFINFDASMSEDLNSAIAITVLEDVLARKKVLPSETLKVVAGMDAVLGLDLLGLTRSDLRIRPVSATITEDEIEAALAERKQARAAKDFARSDAIRDELSRQGVEVMDGDPLGWEWRLER